MISSRRGDRQHRALHRARRRRLPAQAVQPGPAARPHQRRPRAQAPARPRARVPRAGRPRRRRRRAPSRTGTFEPDVAGRRRRPRRRAGQPRADLPAHGARGRRARARAEASRSASCASRSTRRRRRSQVAEITETDYFRELQRKADAPEAPDEPRRRVSLLSRRHRQVEHDRERRGAGRAGAACASGSSTRTSSRRASTCCSGIDQSTIDALAQRLPVGPLRDRRRRLRRHRRPGPGPRAARSSSSRRASTRRTSRASCTTATTSRCCTRASARSSRELSLDLLLLDTHPGLNEETLLSIAVSDAVVIVLRPDQQDYEGTSVTVRVARKLKVPQMMLVVNKTPGGVRRRRRQAARRGRPTAATSPPCSPTPTS